MGNYHHEPKCLQTMHKYFGLFGTSAFYVVGGYGGSSSALSELKKLCQIETKLEKERLDMTWEDNVKEIDMKKEAPFCKVL